jgi:regulator of sirC expression with transglutaminase-like and TPR domain
VRADQLTAWAFRARGVARAGLGQVGGATADYQAYLSLWPQAPDRSVVERWIEELSTVATTGGVAQGVTR